MELKNIFNILLLSLSLATIFITLTSYLIFRIRNTFANKQVEDVHKTKGVFFDRYAPHYELVNRANREKFEGRRPKIGTMKMKLATLFGLSVVLIGTVLLLEEKFSFRMELKKQVKAHEKIRDLIDRGLLKKIEFDPLYEKPSEEEYISQVKKEKLLFKFSRLKDLRFAVVKTKRNEKFNFYNHTTAVESWQDFFQRSGLKYTVVTGTAGLKGFDYVILPQLKSLSGSQRADIDQLIDSGVKVLATGPIGVLNGLGKVSTESKWLEERFGIKPKETPEEEKYRMTMFRSDSSPWWNIPPGHALKWYPLDLEHYYVSENNQLSIVWGDFSNRPILAHDSSLYRTNVNFIEKNKGRMVWMALDPIFKRYKRDEKVLDEIKEFERHYSNEVFASIFNWMNKSAVSKVANWKKGLEGAMVMSVDTEDEFENGDEILEIFEDFDIPATFFVVSDLYQQSSKSLRELDPKLYEIASHSENHDAFDDISLKESFLRLQKSRLDTEEISEQKVVGFRPPFEKYENVTINAVLQNELEYFFGKDKYLSYYPVPIAGGKLQYYPRIVSDDYHLDQSRYLASDGGIVDAMLREYKRVLKFGGGYFFNVHTQVFGKKVFREKIKDFLQNVPKDNVWISKFNDLNKWIMKREKFYSSVVKDNNFINVQVHSPEVKESMVAELSLFVSTEELGKKYELVETDEDDAELVEVGPGLYRIDLKNAYNGRKVSLKLL